MFGGECSCEASLCVVEHRGILRDISYPFIRLIHAWWENKQLQSLSKNSQREIQTYEVNCPQNEGNMSIFDVLRFDVLLQQKQ